MMYAQVVARLTKDPIINSTGDNPMVRGSIAFSSGYGNETSFMNFISYGKTAGIIAEYCKKGNQLFLTGEVRQNNWKNDEGIEFSEHQFIVNRIEFLGNKKQESNEDNNGF